VWGSGGVGGGGAARFRQLCGGPGALPAQPPGPASLVEALSRYFYQIYPGRPLTRCFASGQTGPVVDAPHWSSPYWAHHHHHQPANGTYDLARPYHTPSHSTLLLQLSNCALQEEPPSLTLLCTCLSDYVQTTQASTTPASCSSFRCDRRRELHSPNSTNVISSVCLRRAPLAASPWISPVSTTQ
jgi:hypothetical protein